MYLVSFLLYSPILHHFHQAVSSSPFRNFPFAHMHKWVCVYICISIHLLWSLFPADSIFANFPTPKIYLWPQNQCSLGTHGHLWIWKRWPHICLLMPHSQLTWKKIILCLLISALIVNKYPFQGLFNAMFFRFSCGFFFFLWGGGWFHCLKRPLYSAEALSSVLKYKKAMMCLPEKIHVR